MKSTFLLISQVYLPDPAAVGQYMADVAEELVRRGHRVIVYAARRGYDDPSKAYQRREVVNGVDVRRLPASSFGKSSIKVRLVAQAAFLIQATLRGAFTRNLAGVLVSTSPPGCGLSGALIGLFRRVPMTYWVMDVNPDQLVAMKVLPATAWPVRVFDWINRLTLNRARDVVVLDRFMAARMRAKLPAASEKISVIAPWPLDHCVEDVAHADNPFRQAHARPEDRVFMYSGNHSPVNPLSTLLTAMQRIQPEFPNLRYFSIGAGAGKQAVEDMASKGCDWVTVLPYQPLDSIRFSLSAADIHVVSIGDQMVGVVHPCKIYGVMALSRPMIVLGPATSHLGELVERCGLGWRIAHGDLAGALSVMREVMQSTDGELREMGQRAADVVRRHFARPALLSTFCDRIEAGAKRPLRS